MFFAAASFSVLFVSMLGCHVSQVCADEIVDSSLPAEHTSAYINVLDVVNFFS